MDIRNESIEQWESGFLDAHRANVYDPQFNIMLAKRERESERIATKHLQPWLHILEDSVQWLANLTAILDRMNTAQQLGDAERSVWAMVGASCAQAVAVRRLVLSGLDTPARAAARVLDEHLCACIAFLHDRDLAAKFQQCEGANETAQFWYLHLNTKALRKHLNAIERSVGPDQGFSSDMRSWRANEIESFSQAVHPSYLGAALATLTLSAADPNVHGPAFLGMASACSERTLNFTCKSIWYFACLGFMMIFNEDQGKPPIIPLDEEDEMQQLVVVGRHVIQNINRKYWDHEIYPTAEP